MSSKADFERKLLELDSTKLYALFGDVIGLYVEYIEVHGHTPESARHAAISDTLAGIDAKVSLDDAGEL